MPQIEYLLVQEDQSAYKIHCPKLTSDLPDTCEVGGLIQEATAVFGLLAANSRQSVRGKSNSDCNLFLPLFIYYSSCANPFLASMVCLEGSLQQYLVTSIKPFSRRRLCTGPPGTIYQCFCRKKTPKAGRSLWCSVSHIVNFLTSCSQPPESTTTTTTLSLLDPGEVCRWAYV